MSSLIWIFDLDNTLHDASHAIFGAIDRSMTAAVMKHLQVDHATANEYRHKYWERYGATLIGMQRHHQVNAADFLASSHDFDIASKVKTEPYLAQLLRNLPGRKFIYTNAPLHYAQTVVNTLKIEHEIEQIFAIDQMKIGAWHYPKPSLAMLKRVVKQIQQQTHATVDQMIFVEDTLKNLKPARALGLKTVHLFHPNTPFSSLRSLRPSYVDLRIKHLRNIGKAVSLVKPH